MTKPDAVYHEGRKVIVKYNINPWEFRGYYSTSPGILFAFKWSEVTRFLEGK